MVSHNDKGLGTSRTTFRGASLHVELPNQVNTPCATSTASSTAIVLFLIDRLGKKSFRASQGLG